MALTLNAMKTGTVASEGSGVYSISYPIYGNVMMLDIAYTKGAETTIALTFGVCDPTTDGVNYYLMSEPNMSSTVITNTTATLDYTLDGKRTRISLAMPPGTLDGTATLKVYFTPSNGSSASGTVSVWGKVYQAERVVG